MFYECDKCQWTGTWDALILETLCPLCRSSVTPKRDEKGPNGQASSGLKPGVVPGPPQRG
ncbi:hypothetical protein [uncultured Pseudodesulfovibrio sp.]|uniref:hypothetical protein n=1 Tax=uncultured Pseudodesulfovibrio sp. TaxID=2035858 RepID=UPI0029C6E09C|nr:hypothetical protein [uncultured Pseudodesulfovibrio sp.]